MTDDDLELAAGGKDPVDLVRSIRPVAPIDPAVISRARTDFSRRILEAEQSRPTTVLAVAEPTVLLAVAEPTVDAETTDGASPPPTPVVDDAMTGAGRGRLTYLALVAAVVAVIVGLAVPAMTGDESVTTDPAGDPILDGRVDPAGDPIPDGRVDPGDSRSLIPNPTGGAAFAESFDGNRGLDRFRVGVYHRNLGAQELGDAPEIWGDGNASHGGTWTGDHDLSCGTPDTQRGLESTKLIDGGVVGADFAVDEIVYICRDHLMTSMGDVDAYSIVWFSPKARFQRATSKTVSWDVNVTDLLGRQWWEVSIIPVGTEFLATADWLADVANIGTYHPDAVVISNGPFGGDVGITVDGENRYDGWQSTCGDFGLDPEGCGSKPLRRSFSVTDNDDGTLTVDYGGLFTQTVAGRFPEGFEVYFKDHNYTPDKDGIPAGHTWHWDNIVIG